MKYIVLSRRNYGVFHSHQELGSFLEAQNLKDEIRFENGLDALGKGFLAYEMLGEGEYVIVQAGDVIIPIAAEARVTKWVLPPVDQPKHEKKWRACNHADIGKRVCIGRTPPGSSPRLQYILEDVLIGCRQTEVVGYKILGLDVVETNAWIYE